MPTIIAFLPFLLGLLLILKRKSLSKGKLPPEPSGAWPIIGHLRLLAGADPPHVALAKAADKYGPIFTIKQGVHRTLIVSNWEMAKECLKTNDKVFASRTKSLAGELMAYNYAMFAFSVYSPFWRHLRKISTVELLSNFRIQSMKYVREEEVKVATKFMYELWEKNNNSGKVQIRMDQMLGDTSRNVIYRMIVGKRYTNFSSDDEATILWRNTVKKFIAKVSTFVVSDAVPYLRWLDIGGHEKEMKQIAKNLDTIVEGWLNEHRQKKINGEVKEGEEDFMDMMLSILDGGTDEISAYDADTIVKATCLVLILAAADTTKVTLIWIFCLLLNNPDSIKKIQQELDTHVGRDRLVDDSDCKKLVYLEAVLKEALRLHPPVPLLLPHESTEDCTVNGFHIPAGTRLHVNLWKIHRDPRVWPDPEEFKPERFLTTHKHIDVRGQDLELIPFSAGRRMCPGVSFALHSMQITVAALLQCFDFSTITGGPVEVSEGFGKVGLKGDKLEVVTTPRLPPHLYID